MIPDSSAMRARVRTVGPNDKQPNRLRGGQPLHSAHVGPDGLRQDHAAVGLLPVLEGCDDSPSDREAAAVQGRDQPWFLALSRTEPDLRAPRLELPEGRAGADFAKG